MNDKSEILLRSFEKAREINKDILSKEMDKIDNYKRLIERNNNNIKTALDKIREQEEKKRQFVKKLREIMENSKNHEGGLIYNKLTNSKEEEYKTVIDNFNDFLKGNKITIDTQKKLIEEERESLKNNTNTLNDILEIKEKITNEAIEYGRKEIISLCIGHLKANQMNSDGIKHLQQKINEINNSK